MKTKLIHAVRPFLFLGLTCSIAVDCAGEVTDSAADGFHIAIVASTSVNGERTFEALIDNFGDWWNPAHSHSGVAGNLKLDLERRCMFEKLEDGGFLRHMEIVFVEPGKTLRMTGGLGPLQAMGVHGALQFTLKIQ